MEDDKKLFDLVLIISCLRKIVDCVTNLRKIQDFKFAERAVFLIYNDFK
jgi:hypothetical protein